MKEDKTDIQANLEIVLKNYYKRYKDYSKAYENQGDVREGLVEQLKDSIENTDSSDEGFKNLVKEHILANSIYSSEVSNAATKFFIASEIYQLATEKELDPEMAKDYVTLKRNEFKSAYSVEGGRFIRNNNTDLPEIPQEEYDFLYEYFSKQFEGQ